MPDYQVTIWVEKPQEIQFALDQLQKDEIKCSVRKQKMKNEVKFALFRHDYELPERQDIYKGVF